MLKRNCAVKYVDRFGIEHTVRVEAESLFEAAICGLQRLDSSFGGDVGDRMSVSVEVCAEPRDLLTPTAGRELRGRYGGSDVRNREVSAEPTTYASMIEKLKPWIHSQESPAQEEVNAGRLLLPAKSGTRNSGIRNAGGQARRFR